MRTISLGIAALLIIATFGLAARSHRSSRKAQGVAGQFDYYVLSLSWAPDFCSQAGNKGTANECGAGRRVGFVVHGLWPQDNASNGPENCGGASPVATSIVKTMLPYIPTASLIQHEWSTHGTCSELSVGDFFAAVVKARSSVQIPAQFTSMSQQTQAGTSQIEQEFAAANASFPPQAFRATCTQGELQEARICFSKALAPMACTTSAGECTSATMTVLPPR